MTNFTNNFELNKAHHDSFFKKASENDIEKGGEGSRGGKIIGHTESGKPIYENHDHPAHKNFTSNDHTDAVYAHVNLTSRKSLATKEEKKKHLEEGKKHGASSHTAKQDPDSLDEYKQEEDKAKKNSEGTKSLHKFSVSAQLKQQGGGSYVKHEVQARDEGHALDQVGEMYQPHGNTQFVRGNSKATKVEKSIDSDSLQKAYDILGLFDTYDQIEKGGKPALVGEIRDFGGKKMIKTKMGPNSWRPYFPGGKHEHLTNGDKKEPVKEETKTESKAEKKEPESGASKNTIPSSIQNKIDGYNKEGWYAGRFMQTALENVDVDKLETELKKILKYADSGSSHIDISGKGQGNPTIVIEVVETVDYGSKKFEKAPEGVPHFTSIGKNVELTYGTVVRSSSKYYSISDIESFITANKKSSSNPKQSVSDKDKETDKLVSEKPKFKLNIKDKGEHRTGYGATRHQSESDWQKHKSQQEVQRTKIINDFLTKQGADGNVDVEVVNRDGDYNKYRIKFQDKGGNKYHLEADMGKKHMGGGSSSYIRYIARLDFEANGKRIKQVDFSYNDKDSDRMSDQDLKEKEAYDTKIDKHREKNNSLAYDSDQLKSLLSEI